jgi:hypothetical protein
VWVNFYLGKVYNYFGRTNNGNCLTTKSGILMANGGDLRNQAISSFEKLTWPGVDNSSAFSKTKINDATRSDDYSNNVIGGN